MGIGHHIQKYQAEKAARAALEESETPEMAIADPKTYAVTNAPAPVEDEPISMAAILTGIHQLAQAIASGKSGGDAATRQIELMERLLNKTRPENPEHPGISVYSYPEGDLKRPKPAMKCKVFWVGYEERPEVLTPDEIDALNALAPGEYKVTKADGTKIPFIVKAKHTDAIDPATGTFKLAELSIWFPCKGEAKSDHMSKISYCRQAMGHGIPSHAELYAEIEKLKRELASAAVGAGAV